MGLNIPNSDFLLSFPMEKTGVNALSENIDYMNSGFKRLKIVEKDQVLVIFKQLAKQIHFFY